MKKFIWASLAFGLIGLYACSNGGEKEEQQEESTEEVREQEMQKADSLHKTAEEKYDSMKRALGVD
ncbi:MAG: hypothetical protein JJ975_02420 [Bacteroidia bacterium]|nr:hypothetical protein [Bacteroidia bacterium]